MTTARVTCGCGLFQSSETSSGMSPLPCAIFNEKGWLATISPGRSRCAKARHTALHTQIAKNREKRIRVILSSHLLWRLNSQKPQSCYQLLLDEGCNQKQECLFLNILFRKNSMLVIEQVESLRQLKRVLSQKCRFLYRDRRLDLRAQGSSRQN